VDREVITMEMGLEDSRPWLSGVLDNIDEAVIAVDEGGRVTFINAAGAALTAWEQQDAIGQDLATILCLVNERSRLPLVLPAFQEPQSQVTHLPDRTLLVARDGREIRVGGKVVPIPDHRGKPLGILVLLHDLAAHRQAMEALQQSEARYRTLFEHASDAILLENENDEIIDAKRHYRQTEKALRESEANYRRLFEDSPVSLWEQDFSAVKQQIDAWQRKGIHDWHAFFADHPEFVTEWMDLIQILDTNKASLKLYRASTRQELLTFPGKMIPPEAYDVFRNELIWIAEGRTEFECESVNRTLDGERIDVRVHWSVVPGYEDTLSKVIVSIEDIPRRKWAEAALLQSEQRYALATSAGQVGVWDWNLAANEIYLAPGLKAVLGYEDREIGNRLDDWTSHIHPDDLKQVMAEVDAHLAGRTPYYEIAHRMLHKDGSVRWFLARGTAIHDAEGRPYRVVGTNTDITARIQAEQELQWFKEFNESIVQNMAEGIAVQDAEGYFTFVNPAAAHMLGYEPEEMIGQYWTQVVPPDQQPIIAAADERRVRGEADRYEVELVRRDGRRVPALISGSPRFKGSQFDGTLAVFTNISERVQAEAALARRAREMAALYETSLEINSQPDISALLQAIVQRSAQLLGAPMGGLYLMRPGDKELELVVGYNLPGDYAGTVLQLGEGLSGRIAQTGQPMVIADYHVWEGRAEVYADSPFRRVLGVPLKFKGGVIGVINLTDDEKTGTYSQDEIRLVSLFADQAAIAVENARLLEAEARRRREAETLRAATQALTATLDLQQVLQSILRELRRVVPYDSASVQQLRGNWLEIIGGHGFPNLDELMGIRFDLTAGDNPNREVIRSGAPLILDDAPAAYEEFRREPHALAGIRAWLGVPLLFGERLIGMIALDKKESGFYTPEHAQLAQAFAAQAAIAIENARLFQAERQQRQLAETLREVASVLNTSLDLDQVINLILDQLARVVEYDSASLMLLARQQLRMAAHRGFRSVDEKLDIVQVADFAHLQQVLDTHRPAIIPDTHADPRWLHRESSTHVRCWSGIPLNVQDRTIGLLNLGKVEVGFYTQRDADLAVAFATQAAIAIENARLFQAEREQRELTEALRQATTTISSTLDLEQVLDQILEQMNRVIPSDSACIMLIEDNRARVVRWRGYERFGRQEFIDSLAFHLDETPDLRQVYETREIMIVADTRTHADWVHVPGQDWLRSCATAPICARDRVIGFLSLDSATPGFFNQAHAERLRVFADQASLALEHARLYEAEQRRAREAAAVSAVAQALNATTDLDSICQVVSRELRRIVDHDRLSLALLTESGQDFKMYAVIAEDGFPLGRGVTMPLSSTAAAADVAAGRPHFTPDLAAEIDFPGEHALYDAGLRSRLNLPLTLGQKTIGAINLASTKPNAFSPDQLPVLSQVADAVAATVQTVRLYEEVLQRNRELALLNRIIAASAATQEIETILAVVCRELALAFDVPQSAAALFDEEQTKAVVVAEYLAEGRPPSLGEIIPVTGNPSSQYVLEEKKPLVVDNAQTDPRLAPIHELMRQRGTISLLVLPLLVEGEVVGTLGVDAIEPRPFSDDEVGLAWRVAEQVSGSLARARLLATQRRLSTVVEQAAEAIVITDTEGRALYVNPAFEHITGYSQAEAIGATPDVWIGERAVDTLYHDLWPAVTAGSAWQGQLTGTRPNGSPYTVDLTVTPVRDESGEIANFVATMRDVTREVRLEEQFYQAQKMEALGQLAGGIAHDFNNLLTVIHLSTQLLRRRLRPEDPLWEHVQRIEETGARAAKLTKQLLSFSRRELIEPKVVNMNDLVGELGSMLQRIIGEDIQLKTHLAADLWLVKVDSSQMDQVILNLAVNARDAMPHGGTLTIETSNVILDEAYAAIHVDAEVGRYVLLSISDTGVGMDDAVQAHLFEPFFTTKQPGQGTGLGLATVFGIVKQSGGHIQVSSQVQQGTTFKIYLPWVSEAERHAHPSPAAPIASRLVHGTETILIVEDKAEVRRLAADVLKSCGYQVLTAEHGLEALWLCKAHPGPIHLLLTDVVMPYMNGTELAEQFQVQRPDTRVLYMSGYADTNVLLQKGSAFSAIFLPKPFTVEDLTQRVRSVLDGRG
jgi:PAS domain S-box-containing protein